MRNTLAPVIHAKRAGPAAIEAKRPIMPTCGRSPTIPKSKCYELHSPVGRLPNEPGAESWSVSRSVSGSGGRASLVGA